MALHYRQHFHGLPKALVGGVDFFIFIFLGSNEGKTSLQGLGPSQATDGAQKPQPGTDTGPRQLRYIPHRGEPPGPEGVGLWSGFGVAHADDLVPSVATIFYLEISF